MATVQSSGVAKAGLTTGIIGTSLAGLLAANNGGGLLGGLFGGNNNCAAAMAGQGAYQAAISEKDSIIGQLRAEKYADSVGTGVYAAIAANQKEVYQELVTTRERLAKADANFACLVASVDRIGANVNDINREIADMRVREQRTSDAILLESERRCSGDQNLMCYVNATFVPGRLVMPKDSICPEVMPRWNSWTTPTGEAPATQPISGTVNANVTTHNNAYGCGCNQ
ncbi:hypothetical protein NB636_07870 [Oxalobacter aliiformigenes]|uniref:hypothetical protein n=1 Tax=Oxalobacter aliiformigenes TaxID=2946593 RepID=UPI0022B02B5B|nr:hypothetical protein [Oxalobacter aliiformigenes]MCZ4065744.1 hypothetical protein [Oxalobacter aliiformigenes]WAV98624.1 hypothetical protein NB636_07870 [Oxalobacter aliiformigenes]